MQRTPDTPRGALGRALPGTMVIDPETGRSARGPRFDEHGRLLNAEEAIGEMVSTTGADGLRGVLAQRRRPKRPDPERLVLDRRPRPTATRTTSSTSPAATTTGCASTARTSPPPRWRRILQRHPDVLLASVYAVPDTVVGDQVMAALLLRPGRSSTPTGSPRSSPERRTSAPNGRRAFVRIAGELPTPPPRKILKRVLRSEGGTATIRCWWQPSRGAPYRLMVPADVDELDRVIAAR